MALMQVVTLFGLPFQTRSSDLKVESGSDWSYFDCVGIILKPSYCRCRCHDVWTTIPSSAPPDELERATKAP
eukprot:3532529-Amphidinium_carterae.1